MVSLKALFPLYTFKDLMEALPAVLKISEANVLKEVKKSGQYRSIAGQMFFTSKDVEKFIDFVSAAPSPNEERALLGAGRVLSGARPAPNETGYMVIIGEQLNRDGFLFVGWAPVDDHSVADLKAAVQFGFPKELVVLGYRAATPQQVAELKEELKDFRERTDSDAWYINSGDAADIMYDYMQSPIEDDEDEAEDEGTRPTPKGAKKD